ncbi:MAG: hypothetical protein Q8Q39_00590 [bacterium]|nr:hypothetical protein [bacterium]
MKPKWKFLYLYIPIVVAIMLDYALTIDGNRGYFLGQTATVNEEAPLGKFLLIIGPATFTVCILLYLAWLGWMLKALPEGWKLFVCLATTYLHAYGAESWIKRHIPQVYNQWIFHVFYTAAFTALVAFMIRQYQTACENNKNANTP